VFRLPRVHIHWHYWPSNRKARIKKPLERRRCQSEQMDWNEDGLALRETSSGLVSRIWGSFDIRAQVGIVLLRPIISFGDGIRLSLRPQLRAFSSFSRRPCPTRLTHLNGTIHPPSSDTYHFRSNTSNMRHSTDPPDWVVGAAYSQSGLSKHQI
jgi:hypothetical protein